MRLRAHAKINLDLRVLDTRPDGYHDISTVFQTLALHDVVTVEPRAGPIVVTADDPSVPAGEANLCARAVRALWTECGRHGQPSGVNVRIEKRIPMAAGLGGGSSDAAATLLGAARLWGLGDDDPRMRQAAAVVGADVAFFLVGGTALGTGKGDVLTPLPDAPEAEVVLVQPPFGVSTPEAYRWCDELRTAGSGPSSEGERGGSGSPGAWRNDLEPGVALRHPDVAAIARQLRMSLARFAAMTGSGSVVFGLFDSAEAADRGADLLQDGTRRVIRTRLLTRAEFDRSRRGLE
jgi:4-diphosphocytidyl-2-C-methyl-D-erythritol kinase